MINNSESASYEKCIQLLKEKGIKVVAFDMDQTAVSVHSRGRLRRDGLDSYLNQATHDFRNIVPELHKHGFGLSISTHSDEAEFGGDVQPESHILGSELAQALVDRHFEPAISSAFKIIAYNPRFHPDDSKEENKIKRCHIRKLLEHFKVLPKDIVFLDDVKEITEDCNQTCGVNAILVDAKQGFKISDLLENL